MILKNRIAIVTGARVGIGRALALGFAGEGAHIVINDIQNEDASREVISQVQNMGRKAIHVQGDVALEEDVGRIVSATLDAFGRIDILVNNAGLRTIAYLGVENRPALEMEVKDWDRMIAVNLRGPFLMSKAVLPQMIKQRQGSIINISSGAGREGVPGKSAYCASKHGLEGFTKSLAGEVKAFNIRVNALAPGGRVDTDGLGGLPAGVIVPAGIFLASDDSRGITGESIIAKDWNQERGIEA
ncbi:MAG: SDR family NAD(P)-dependent oxidoreductase [Deltaproteobacteria bacterium]|nr:SDR family NAD(P)-dependent oxidoreductase [Deltaproteobacteria bacterium]